MPWQRRIRQHKNKKTKPKVVLLTCLLPFLVTKPSRLLEKKMVNKTRVSKTVLGPLNARRIKINYPVLFRANKA